MRASAPLLLTVLLLPGCFGGDAPDDVPRPTNGDDGPEGPEPFRAAAPWWDGGDYWVLSVSRAGQQAERYRMINFWNETATEHFWLGVDNRDQAMRHALFDTNPLLGRVHWRILSPHERGIHAGMYSFPLEDGKRWSGELFDRSWTFTAREAELQHFGGRERGFRIGGIATDGARVAVDYAPSVEWLTRIEVTDARGATELLAQVEDHGTGAQCDCVFFRGRDFYEGPQAAGTHEETFDANEPVDRIALYVDLQSAGPVEVQFVDPNGSIAHRVTATTGTIRQLAEVDTVQGTWTVRYIAPTAYTGSVLATGLYEISCRITAGACVWP